MHTKTLLSISLIGAVVSACGAQDGIVIAESVRATTPLFVWPLSGTTTPDPMYTSFGPRINRDNWDFHDGIDLPAAIGTDIHAVRTATVFRADDANSNYRSRHVILKTDDPATGDTLYVVHLHLSDINVYEGQVVSQGAVIGEVGDDDASFPHLHFEFRRGSSFERDSEHPLNFLPYTDTDNFWVASDTRFNQINGALAARIEFRANDRNEGDLDQVDVELYDGAVLLETRTVHFDDKDTLNPGNGDHLLFRNDVGVEGYQGSNMGADNYDDLHYGVLVRNLPTGCDKITVIVTDIGQNVTSHDVSVPSHTAQDLSLNFEDGVVPPTGWTLANSSGSISTTAESVSPLAGNYSLRSVDGDSNGYSDRASIQHSLSSGRIQWRAAGSFHPVSLSMASQKNVYPIHFLKGSGYSVVARIRRISSEYVLGITAKKPNGSAGGRSSDATVSVGTTRDWALNLVRVGTRETTAVLFLDGTEIERYSWDGRTYEPDGIRLGLGYTSGGVTATMRADDLVLTEDF